MRKVGFFVLLLAVIVACSNRSDDITTPQIELFNMVNNDLTPGEALSIDVSVSDNEELNQMRIRIREAFAKTGGHWSLVRVFDLSGREHSQTYDFTVPDTALAGMYEVGLQVVDLMGNASIDSLQLFFISRSGEQPSFVNFNTQPAADELGRIFLFASDTLVFTGLITDNVGLETVNIQVKSSNGSNLQNITYSIADTLNGVWDASLSADSLTFDVTNQFPAEVVVKALNIDGHQSRLRYQLEFLF
jgi:hypothetical protein